jgi:pimeloyl-ACP methyl ester carboxylesterase
MTATRFPIPVAEHSVAANGITIWYAEAGQGLPLLLLHGGIASNGPIWADSAYGWGGQISQFAQHFRVIAPDTRGHGRTRNASGVLTYPDFAADVIALIHALHLEQPLLGGFSDGGITALLVGILAPDLPQAIVNLAGLDMFDPNPDSPARIMNRTWLGGDPKATRAASVQPGLPAGMAQKVATDFEPTQGTDYLKAYFEQLFALWTVPMAYTTSDLAKITAPTLLLVGDRETGLPVEEVVTAFRTLPRGELGVIPNADHGITPLACTLALDFLLRQRATAQA